VHCKHHTAAVTLYHSCCNCIKVSGISCKHPVISKLRLAGSYL
jgi:hypothetical protein